MTGRNGGCRRNAPTEASPGGLQSEPQCRGRYGPPNDGRRFSTAARCLREIARAIPWHVIGATSILTKGLSTLQKARAHEQHREGPRCTSGQHLAIHCKTHAIPRPTAAEISGNWLAEEGWSEWQDLNLRPPRPER